MMVSLLSGNDFNAFTGATNSTFASADTTSNSLDGVVVLGSTDCSSSSSSSSGCSGHSDTTSDPGSPYSSPTSAALCSPVSTNSDDDPALIIDEDQSDNDEPEPRPPDPHETRKRTFPFNNNNNHTTSTPKLFKNNSGNSGTISTTTATSLLSTIQTIDDQKLPNSNSDSKHNNNNEVPKQQKTNKSVDKGQGKITEYFKTQLKSSAVSGNNKNSNNNNTQQMKKKDGIDKFLRLYSSNTNTKDVCVQPVLIDKETKIFSLLRNVNKTFTNKDEETVEERLSLSTDENNVVTNTRRLSITEEINCNTNENHITVVETITNKKTDAVSVIEIVANEPEIANNNKTDNTAPLSPILSVPKILRFPVPAPVQQTPTNSNEPPQTSVLCKWDKCDHEFMCSSKLLEHIQSTHVTNQRTKGECKYFCLWIGCKVHGKESCSYSWLERHVLIHGGNKPFRCVMDGCGQRFSSQVALQRHVNSHFNTPSNSNGNSNGTRRNNDTITTKLFKRNGKKLRYRRQPWSARMFDYIDSGMMEGVQYRLLTFMKQQLDNVTSAEQAQQISNGNHIALRSKIIARRTESNGKQEILVRWLPEDLIPDEWLPIAEFKESKVVEISKLSPSSAITLHHSLLPKTSKTTRKPRKAVIVSQAKRMS